MTRTERHRLTDLLTSSRDALVTCVGRLTDVSWRTRPGPDAWSPLEVVEHLTMTEHAIRTLVTVRLPNRPAAGDNRSAVSDDVVISMTESRRERLVAPDRLRPPGSPSATPADLISAFNADRAAILHYVATTDHDLRASLAPHPLAGMLDSYQWLLFLGAHTHRHIEQIVEATRA